MPRLFRGIHRADITASAEQTPAHAVKWIPRTSREMTVRDDGERPLSLGGGRREAHQLLAALPGSFLLPVA